MIHRHEKAYMSCGYYTVGIASAAGSLCTKAIACFSSKRRIR